MHEIRNDYPDGFATAHTPEGLINSNMLAGQEESQVRIEETPEEAYWYDICPSKYFCVDDTSSIK